MCFHAALARAKGRQTMSEVNSVGLLTRSGKPANEVVVVVGTGDWGRANVKAFVEPFEKETGIAVKVVDAWFDDDAMRSLGSSGKSHVDVVPVGHVTVVSAGEAGWLAAVDYSRHDPAHLNDMQREAKRPFGIAPIYYSINIAYWKDRFPNGGPRTWADFWNVGRFPGERSLRSGDYPAGLLESALLADGVPADRLYPLDIDRAFASLDRIKPHIAVWWRDGVDMQEAFVARSVDLGSGFNGRVGTLQDAGHAIDVEWNEGFLLLDYFVMPRGGPNPENAQTFMAFLSRPENQAAFAALMPYGPTSARAYDFIDEQRARALPSYAANIGKQIIIDTEWYLSRIGDTTNFRYVMERWNKWLADLTH